LHVWGDSRGWDWDCETGLALCEGSVFRDWESLGQWIGLPRRASRNGRLPSILKRPINRTDQRIEEAPYPGPLPGVPGRGGKGKCVGARRARAMT
jgi:hypothetical protein